MYPSDVLMLAGDLNACMGTTYEELFLKSLKGKSISNLPHESRRSWDTRITSPGKSLASEITDNGLLIVNGCPRFDSKGDFTHINHCEVSVIAWFVSFIDSLEMTE